MKKNFILFISALAVLATIEISRSDIPPKLKLRLRLQKPDVVDLKFVASNNWRYVMRNQGSFMFDFPDADGNGNNAGGEFPRGSGTTIMYAGGLYIGTIKNSVPVVSETEFATEFQPGRITNSGLPWNQLIAEDKNDPANRVHLISRQTLSSGTVDWPEDAPHDIFGSPGLVADAQTWAVFNDLDTLLNQELGNESPYPGLGIEVILESFAVNGPIIGDVVFLKFTLTNKTDTDYPQTYFGGWADPDVDDTSNDIIGTDTTRNLIYCYNSNNNDEPLAVGYDFMQGPVAHQAEVAAKYFQKFGSNTRKLSYGPEVNSYLPVELPAGYFIMGAVATNTYIGSTDPVNNSERYNLLRGFNKFNGQPKAGCGWDDYYVFRGNPLTESGCNVADQGDAADQRYLVSTGPFTLKAGEPQEIWMAVIGGKGGSVGPSVEPRLNALWELWQTSDVAEQLFDAGLSSPRPPESPKTSISAYGDRVVLTWENNAEQTYDRFGDAASVKVSNGYSADYVSYDFQGYRVYRSLTGLSGSYELLAQFDKADELGVVSYRELSENGNLIIKEIDLGSNTGLQYSFIDTTIVPGTTYFYSVTAYDAQPYIESPDFIPLQGQAYQFEAQGTAAILLDASSYEFIVMDSVALVRHWGYRSNGGGLALDTLKLTDAIYVVWSVRYFTEIASSSVLSPIIGGQAVVTKTVGFAIVPDIYVFSVGVTFTTTAIHTTNNSIRRPAGIPVSLESPIMSNSMAVTVLPPVSSMIPTAGLDSSLAVHSEGTSDGFVTLEVIDPNAVETRDYQIEFFEIPTSSGGGSLVGLQRLPSNLLAYRVKSGDEILRFDSRTDDPRTFYDVNLNGMFESGTDLVLDDAYFGTEQVVPNLDIPVAPVIVNGVRIIVYSARNDVKMFQCVANATGPFPNPDMGAFAFNGSGFPTFPGKEPAVPDPITIFAANDGLCDRPNVPNLLGAVGAQSVANGAKWGLHVGGGGTEFHYRGSAGAFVERVFRNDNFTRFVPYDFELRFTAAGGEAHFAFTSGAFAPVPFEIWNIGNNTPTNTADDYRMYPRVLDEGGAVDVYDYTGFDHPMSGGDNDPYLDWIYFMRPSNQTPGQAGYNATVGNGTGVAEVMARTVLVSFNGGSVSDVSFPANALQSRPANGTVFRIISTKPNTASDVFTFSTTANTPVTSKKALNKALDRIQVVPNPFYAVADFNGSGRGEEKIRFTNLPSTCIIKIFTVSGDLVKIIYHNSSSNNLRTDSRPYDDEEIPDPQYTSVEEWDLTNARGHKVAGGMYIALFEIWKVGKTLKKFAVIR